MSTSMTKTLARTLREGLTIVILGMAASLPVTAAPASEPAASTVRIDNFHFNPPTLTVPAGTTVTWVNHDDSPHTVTSSANPHLFNSPAMDTDDRFTYTFTTPGTYRYFCAIHPHMVGVIVVK